MKTRCEAKSTAHTNTVLSFDKWQSEQRRVVHVTLEMSIPKNLAQNMYYVKDHMSLVLIFYVRVEQEINFYFYMHNFSPRFYVYFLLSKQHNVMLLSLFLSFCLHQEIRNQASEYPYKVAKLPANRNLNRYRDVSPCESHDKLGY